VPRTETLPVVGLHERSDDLRKRRLAGAVAPISPKISPL
jgi:hypothetical protein